MKTVRRTLSPTQKVNMKTVRRTLSPTQKVNMKTMMRLPELCGVCIPSIQDPMLAQEYSRLPNLRFCELVSWASARGPGRFSFSSWRDQSPNMSLELCRAVLNFAHFGRFINPSRADPRITTALGVSVDGLRSNLMIDAEPAVLISTIFCTESHLLAPATMGLRRKFISGIAHTQEWERQMSFIGMAFGHRSLHAQLLSDAMSYTTKVDYAWHGQHPVVGVATSDIALRVSDQVPIYDARFTVFHPIFDWPVLDALLPPFMAEVPYGSCVAVAYTCNCYPVNGRWNLSTNIRFAVVLGTP
ncbi:hypothetical protein GALMADRAFT_162489 [Galerina marginata CBS 339.88]|uniref:Uncharacterized protein n=1 Tax=Galerina marginata (strain CBS 339.88) TaxID=685588 RepID=A0A067S2N5_GALM3|nr:hypothetical protein GALMADRAFT_162489 [Galerina marginata CBS 339.88]